MEKEPTRWKERLRSQLHPSTDVGRNSKSLRTGETNTLSSNVWGRLLQILQSLLLSGDTAGLQQVAGPAVDYKHACSILKKKTRTMQVKIGNVLSDLTEVTGTAMEPSRAQYWES